MPIGRLHCALIVCLALLGTTGIVIAQQPPATQPAQVAIPATQQNQAAAAPASASAAIPSYPDTPKGLEDLMKEMLKLEKKHDAQALAPYVQSLVLPNPVGWFRATFGDDIGQQLADSYDRTSMNLPLGFPDLLEQLNSKHFANPKALLFTDSCNPDATTDEYQVLVNRVNQQPLYDVLLASSHAGSVVLPYFAYVDGAFRFLGNFRLNLPTKLVAVNENVMKRKIVNNAVPVYPQSALMEHISGVVVLHAILDANGRVCSLQVVSGNPLLADAASTAVGLRRYSPYEVNGRAVTVETTITVTFELGP